MFLFFLNLRKRNVDFFVFGLQDMYFSILSFILLLLFSVSVPFVIEGGRTWTQETTEGA